MSNAPVSFSPYDYRIHEDPYPVYARLREEAPLYRNEEQDFWALSRHADVSAAFREPARFSSANGVSLDPSAWGPNAHKTMSFLAFDDVQGEVVGFWKQVAGATRPDGSNYIVAGIGGSWFRYGGNWQWSWQRDFFDLGNATALFLEMIKADVLSPGMQRRMERSVSGEKLPGHYPIGGGPAILW